MRFQALSKPAEPRPAHHTRRGFRNLPGSPKRVVTPGDYMKFIWRRVLEARTPPDVPEGHVLDRGEVLALLEAHEGTPSLTWLGHAAFMMRAGGMTVLLDPYLGEYASPVRGIGPKRFVPAAIPPEMLPPADVMVISHNHYDHLCAETLERLPNKANMTAIVPLGLGKFLRRRGFRHVRELDWHHSATVGALRATALPAVHWSKRKPWDRNRTLWASFALEIAGLRVYFSGDTGYSSIFRDIGESYGPFDVALVGIGAYDPQPMMHAHHTNPEEAVKVGRDVGAQTLVAMHWGTVVLTDEDPFEPPARFRLAAAASGYADEDAWVLRIGETRALRVVPRNAV